MDKIARLIRPEIRALTAYQVPPTGFLVKLDAMENPYGWPEPLTEAWLAELRGASLNRYPDPTANALRIRLRHIMGVPEDAAVLLGNGSDELIQMIALALAAPGRVMLAPEPTFVMYRIIAASAGMNFVGVPLMDDFGLPPATFLKAVDEHQPAVIFLAYPNNPTGNLFNEEHMRAIIKASPGLVVVDEAYHVFAGKSFMAELAEYDNLLILRTLSKMGLAGLRLGLLAGPRNWLAEIDKVRLPYNINVLTQISADFALRHHEVIEAQARRICEDRGKLMKKMRQLDPLTVYPSSANFILFRVPGGRASQIFEMLKSAGVLIKNMHGQGALQDCLRVTIGRPEENSAFFEALAASL